MNQDFDYSVLVPFLEYSINNVGDPFHPSNFWGNTHEIGTGGHRHILPVDATLSRTMRGVM